MPQQKRRDVLFMDVHGVLCTAEDSEREGIPLIGSRRHEKWVDAVRQALQEAGALPLQIKEGFLEPRALWELRMRIELMTPKTRRSGQVIPERKFYQRVNLALLQKVAPSFMASINRRGRKLVEHRMKDLQRHAPRYGYILEPEMRECVHWLVEEDKRWMLYLTTAGDPQRVAKLFRSENVPTSLFIKVFTTETVGLPKSHPDFWRRVAAESKSSPDRCVVIEDNLIMGIHAAKVGMSVIFLDRGYGIEEFIRRELNGEVAGVHLSQVGESLPHNGERFVVCAKSPAGIKLCLQRVTKSQGGGM